MIGKLIMGIILILGATALIPTTPLNVICSYYLWVNASRELPAFIMFLIGFILCVWYVAEREDWPEWRKKIGAIRCQKCGREMRSRHGHPDFEIPLWFWVCDHCQSYVPILPNKFKKKRQEAREQLEKQAFRFNFTRTYDGKEVYRKGGSEASLDWAGKLHIFDIELARRLYEERDQGKGGSK